MCSGLTCPLAAYTGSQAPWDALKTHQNFSLWKEKEEKLLSIQISNR